MEDKVARYQDIRSRLSTGDLILMHGVDVESSIIRLAELSPWSHVAMVVRVPDLGPPLIWESTPLHFIEDVVLHTKKSGARIVSLDDRLRVAVTKKFYSRFAVRRLDVERTPEMISALQEYIERVHNLPFPSTWELARDYVKGRFFDEEARFDHVYCAELVAETYMHMGVLAADHPPNRYAPKDFSSEVDLPLLKGARLLKEIFFTVEPDFPVQGHD